MEYEIAGAEDTLTQCLWPRYFIEGQGYTVEELDLYHDNMSAMLMEKNGKESDKQMVVLQLIVDSCS